MNKNYKLGDSVSLVMVKFASIKNDEEQLVYTVPNEKGVDKTPYEDIFPFDAHPYVRAEIYLHDILIIDVFEQPDGGELFIAANKKLNTVKYRYDGEGHYDAIVDNQSVTNQFTVCRPFDLQAEDPRRFIWLKDDGTFAVDIDYIQFIINENQKWNESKVYRIDREFFNLLVGFMKKVKRNLVVDNTLVPGDLRKLRKVAFSKVKNRVFSVHGRKTCALIAQFLLPNSVNHNVFLSHMCDELMAAFPFKRDLKKEDIGIHYEKISVNTPSPHSNSRVETRLEVKIIIFTGLYNRLQSSIVGKRSTGTLADKLMTAWADSLFDLGVDENDIKLNMYLNEKRLLLVNYISETIFEIYNQAVLPINDERNWRNKIEQFVKHATIVHGNKPVNLCCLKLHLPFDVSAIPNEAILRLRAEVKCEKNSEVLWINDEGSVYLFYTERCVKARLRTTEEMSHVSYSLTSYLKNVFEDKIHINYTVKDYFTLFNLYSDIDIESVYQTVLSRHNVLIYTKPALTVY